MSETARTDQSGRVVSASSAGVDALLGDVRVSPSFLWAAIQSLSVDDLRPFGYTPTLINMLAVYGTRKSRADIESLAAVTTRNKMYAGWAYRSYMAKVDASVERPYLKNFPVMQIRDLLSRGKGIVLASYQYGHGRYLVSDSAIAGFPTILAVAADAHRDYSFMRVSNAASAVWRQLSVANVETRSGVASVVRGLKRGAVVVLAVDGNTGTDGPHGKENRQGLQFMGCSALAKNGFARMALICNSTILPIIADGVTNEVTTLPPIEPPANLSPSVSDDFTAYCLQQLYSHLENAIERQPEYWGHWHVFHRWRLPVELPPGRSNGIDLDLESSLNAGFAWHVDFQRIVATETRGAHLWTDVQTLRSFFIPPEWATLAERLTDSKIGVTKDWLEQTAGYTTSLPFLRALAAKNILARCN